MQHEFFDGCTWDVKAPGKDKESNYLRSKLLRILPIDLHPLFTNDSKFDNDGFLMLKHLVQYLQPDSHQNKFLNMLELANLTRGDNESEASLISRAKGIDNVLAGVSIADCMPLKILSCLNESYPGLIARYCQGDPAVVNATVSQLESLMAAEREAQRAFPNLYPPASANRARSTTTPSTSPAANSAPSTMTPSYPPSKGVQWDKAEDLVSEGKICPVCFSRGQWHVNDGSFRCVPLAKHGCIIKADQNAADKLVADYEAYTQQTQNRGGRGTGRAGRGGQGGRGGCSGGRANNTTTDPAPTGTDAPVPDAQVRRATSAELGVRSGDSAAGGSVPPHSDNRYGILDRELDLDSADDAAYDDADFALADNSNNSDTVYIVSARHATADQPLACCFVSSAISSLATAHLSKNRTTIAKPVANTHLVVADSGATDTMLLDYSAFLSYRRQVNRFVTLGDAHDYLSLAKGVPKLNSMAKSSFSENAFMSQTFATLFTPYANTVKCLAVAPTVIMITALSFSSHGSRYKLMMSLTTLSLMNPLDILNQMLLLITVSHETILHRRHVLLLITWFNTRFLRLNVFGWLLQHSRHLSQQPLPSTILRQNPLIRSQSLTKNLLSPPVSVSLLVSSKPYIWTRLSSHLSLPMPRPPQLNHVRPLTHLNCIEFLAAAGSAIKNILLPPLAMPNSLTLVYCPPPLATLPP
jgi:hypothetical protein